MGRPGRLRPRRGQAHCRQQGEVGHHGQVPQRRDRRAREDPAVVWRGEGNSWDVGGVSAFDISVGAGAVDEYFTFGIVSAEFKTVASISDA